MAKSMWTLEPSSQGCWMGLSSRPCAGQILPHYAEKKILLWAWFCIDGLIKKGNKCFCLQVQVHASVMKTIGSYCSTPC